MRARGPGTGVVLTKLLEYRDQALLTQQELAERANVSRATITDAERGLRISYRNARKLAHALGVSPALLR